MDNKAVEEEIIKEHGQAISFIGQKVYQLVLPYAEIGEAVYRVLQLNRQMYKLKEAAKAEKSKVQAAV